MNKSALTQRGGHSWSRIIKMPASFPASFSILNSAHNRPESYFSALVHEIRNPLCNITMACDVLNLSSLDEEQRECLNIIMRGSFRVGELINTILKLEGIESVKYELYSLQQLLEDVLIIAKDRILLKNIRISREYAAPQDRVPLDVEKMKIALINIVNNAIDAMPSERGELKVATRSVGQQSSVEIQDNGIGISKENLERIFEPYFTNKPGGMGLGLSATLGILRANHVKVDVQSEEGLGTSFILSFVKR